MRETDPVNEAKEAFRVFDAEGFGFIGRSTLAMYTCIRFFYLCVFFSSKEKNPSGPLTNIGNSFRI
jgi:Ca2+-binding EF-hand superfamily protein